MRPVVPRIPFFLYDGVFGINDDRGDYPSRGASAGLWKLGEAVPHAVMDEYLQRFIGPSTFRLINTSATYLQCKNDPSQSVGLGES